MSRQYSGPRKLERLKQKLNDLAEDVSGLESSSGKAQKERQSIKKEIASLHSRLRFRALVRPEIRNAAAVGETLSRMDGELCPSRVQQR